MNDSHPDTDWADPLKKRFLWIAIPLFALCVGMGWLTMGGR